MESDTLAGAIRKAETCTALTGQLYVVVQDQNVEGEAEYFVVSEYAAEQGPRCQLFGGQVVHRV